MLHLPNKPTSCARTAIRDFPVGQPIVTTIHSINYINQDKAECGQLAILAMGYDYGKLLTMAAVWELQEVTTTPYTGDP